MRVALLALGLLWGGTALAVEVALGGDCLLGRGVSRRAAREARSLPQRAGRARREDTAGWSGLLAGAAALLRTADLAIVNLESPLAPCLAGGDLARPRLCGDPRGLAALRGAGIDAVTLANNHALDAGAAGLRATARLLRESGIVPLGLTAALTGRPRPERVGSITVVAASLTPAAHQPGSKVPATPPVALARAVRLGLRLWPGRPVLVLLHGGREMDRQAGPREAPHIRAAVLAGASAVAMHGAHVVRRLYCEPKRAGGCVPVHLGLGNLLFDQREEIARLGALLVLQLDGTGPARVRETACVDATRGAIRPCARPRPGGSQTGAER